MKKTITSICLITLTMLICNCGSGMIGLLEKDKHDRLVMYTDIYTIENGCEYNIYVEAYYEPDASCGLSEIKDVFYKELTVEKKCANWDDPIILSDPYINLVATSLHEEYLNLLCGE